MMSLSDFEKISPVTYTLDVRDQLKDHIFARSTEAFARGDGARDASLTPRALARRQAAMRRKFIAALGGLPSSNSPLNSRTVGEVRGNGFRIEKVIFESRPKVYVTANLYLPDGLDRPRGAVLFLSGHHEMAKHVGEYQIVCQCLVQAGLIVFAQDPIGQGERFSYYEKSTGGTTVGWGVPEHQHVGNQCLPVGDTLARYFVHDAMRGIDYLCTRKEVDPRRIGVTGNSGGGTQTSLMMLCDPRIAAAAPATFIMNREGWMHTGGCQDSEQVWPGMTAEGFDHEDILLMMCPKPVCVLAVKYDFFPIEGTRRTVERCRRLWKLHRQEKRLQLVEDSTTHLFTPKLAVAAAEFFSQHLLGRKVTPRAETISPFAPSKLWCTRSGQVRGEIPGARGAFEENLDRVRECERKRNAFPAPERRREALAWLKKQVFRDRKPCELNPRIYAANSAEDMEVQLCYWWSQQGLTSHGLLFRPLARAGRKLPVTLAVWDGGGSALRAHHDWLRATCAAGRAALVLETTGTGNIRPNLVNTYPLEDFYGSLHKFNDDLIWLKDSLVALRTYDVLRALDMIAIWPGLDDRDIRAYAHGLHGLYPRLAAALDRRIRKIQVVGGLRGFGELCRTRHYDTRDIFSVTLPGILRHGDLNELRPLISRAR